MLNEVNSSGRQSLQPEGKDLLSHLREIENKKEARLELPSYFSLNFIHKFWWYLNKTILSTFIRLGLLI